MFWKCTLKHKNTQTLKHLKKSVVLSARAVYVAVFEFGLFGVADAINVAAEEEIDTGHWVVEVDFHGGIGYGGDHALEVVALVIGEGQYLADFEQAFRDRAVFLLENFFGQVHQHGFIVFAVCISGLDAERERVAGFKSFDIAFKIGDHHTDAEDECERIAAFRGFYQRACGGTFREGVVHGNHLVFFNYHCIELENE